MTRFFGLPLPLGVLSASQMGVPVAAATIGIQQNLLAPGEPAALILGALVTMAAATIAAGGARQPPRKPRALNVDAGTQGGAGIERKRWWPGYGPTRPRVPESEVRALEGLLSGRGAGWTPEPTRGGVRRSVRRHRWR